MYLLLKHLSNMFKAKRTRALQQYHLIVKLMKDGTGKEIFGSSEKVFLTHQESAGLCTDVRAYTNQFLYTSFCAEGIDLSIEVLIRHAALEDITKNERITTCRTTLHEVESYIERVDVAIVRVIDKCAAALTLFHLQSHGDGFKGGHAIGQFVGSQSQIQCYCSTDDTILRAGIVDERDGIGTLCTFIYI